MSEQRTLSGFAQARSNDVGQMVNSCEANKVENWLCSLVERERMFLETKENGKLAVSRTGLVFDTAHKMEEAGLCVNQASNTNEEGDCNKQKLDDVAGRYCQHHHQFGVDMLNAAHSTSPNQYRTDPIRLNWLSETCDSVLHPYTCQFDELISLCLFKSCQRMLVASESRLNIEVVDKVAMAA